MPYCDDFWHVDAREDILSPACLTVFVKSKTENQGPHFRNFLSFLS